MWLITTTRWAALSLDEIVVICTSEQRLPPLQLLERWEMPNNISNRRRFSEIDVIRCDVIRLAALVFVNGTAAHSYGSRTDDVPPMH